ncbi:hypothetical protein AVEN_28676-1 [Araneus ventricosus]|uniref:Uncharacterized protein n=1 Tax=Araneus ventricosus TaxID=182803 RepID=A0A4Y2X0Y2_ARAVE|nr:hypothetical protein AVEN_28676-1 [Araneus ventricosus]
MLVLACGILSVYKRKLGTCKYMDFSPETLEASFNAISQDMNIIEPIWVALQCAVQKRSPPPGSLLDLRTALQDSWCGKPPGYFQTLVDTMPSRVAALLCARVGPKRY